MERKRETKSKISEATKMMDLSEHKKLDKIIDCELSRDFNTVEIFPLSDLHIGAPETDIEAFRKFIAHIQAEPNRFVILAGDLMNNAIKSSVSNVYEEIISPREQKKFVIKELEKIRDRIIAIVPGNHELRSAKETDTQLMEDIADQLGKPSVYRPDDALIKITFGKKGGRENKRQCYSVYVTHGGTGGKRPGSALNNLELLGLSIDADVYVIGHAHKRMAYKSMFRRVDLYNNCIRETERLFVVSSHWQDFSGYARRKMLLPSAKGSVPIVLHGNTKKMDAII